MNTLLYKRIKDDTTRAFTKAFMTAGIGFALICVLGFATYGIINSGVVLKDEIEWAKAHVGRFSANFYTSGGAAAATTLRNVSFAAMGLIIISSVLRMVWWFRFNTAGKVFIFSTYTIYIIAQGLGFGILFTTFQASELLVIFGVAGVMFILMAFAGYHAKDLRNITVFLVYGSIGMFVVGLMSMILFFTGVYSETLMFLWFLGGAILSLIWIIWDVGMLRRFAAANSLNGWTDEMAEFRIVAFFGFRLMSDLVNLVWTIARLMRYFRS